MNASKKKFVRWKKFEQELLLEKCKEIRLQGPVSILDAMRDAQRILPADRQRKLIFSQLVPPKLRRQLTKFWQQSNLPATTVPPYIPTPAPQVPAMATSGGGVSFGAEADSPGPIRLESATSVGASPVSSPTDAGALPASPVDAGVFDHLCDSVGAYLADRVMSAMLQRIKDRAQDVLAQAGAAIDQSQVNAPEPKPKPAAKPRPRIVVVGPLGEQARMLENEFKEEIDLRIVDKNVTDFRLKQMSDYAQKVVLWTNFVSHHHVNNIPRDKLEYVNGGMTKMREKLTELYVNL